MIVYYGSSFIFAFLMTFSEISGDALSISIFGLFSKLLFYSILNSIIRLMFHFIAMMFIESLLVLQEVALPNWLLPNYSTFDVITIMHRLYPVFINCTRSITGAFYEDIRQNRVKLLTKLTDIINKNGNYLNDLLKQTIDIYSNDFIENNSIEFNDNNNETSINESIPTIAIGLMDKAIIKAEKSILYKPIIEKSQPNFIVFYWFKYEYIRNLLIYLIVSYVYNLYRTNKPIEATK